MQPSPTMPNIVPIALESQMLESLRESDFDCYSAYGEVVDNSIQADSSFCKIRTKASVVSQPGRPYERISEMAFGDDGCGMDQDTIHRCLSLGWSSRFGDRSGIGRFGVGMTLGAIHEARRVEVFSRQRGGVWRRVYIDLDELRPADTRTVGIAPPVTQEPDRSYLDLVGSQSGTLVIWKKYDRQPSSYQLMLPEVRHWLGRTFRKFIWRGFRIEVDNKLVAAFDPLFAETSQTEFPNDPKARLFDDIKLSWPVASEDQQIAGLEESCIRIRMSLLPREFRERRGDGGSAKSKERRIPDNEGISILRQGREVFYDHMPHWPGGAPTEVDRFWGCEIEFEPALDRSFAVKNIKRGAVPCLELKTAIYDKIKGTIKHCRDKVREDWAKAEIVVGPEQGGTVTTGHEVAQSVAARTPTPAGLLDLDKVRPVEAAKAVDTFLRDRSEEERAQFRALFESQPFTLADGRWAGPHFMEVSHLGGSDLITYNQNHPFNEALYERMHAIENDGNSGADDARWLRACIDLLLIAYAKAETMIDPRGPALPPEDILDALRINWGQYLKRYVETWRATGSSFSDRSADGRRT